MSQNDLSGPSDPVFANRPRTPAGLQPTGMLANRRRFVFMLNALSYIAILFALGNVLGAGGWTIIDALLLLSFSIALPWSLLGFWNSLIGFWLLRYEIGRAHV